MKRRDLVIVLGGAAAGWPLVALAQQPKQYRIAIVATIDPVAEMHETGRENWRTFFRELRRLGYVEGQNLVVERYSVEGHNERHAEMAQEVVSRNPEVIVVANNFVTGVYKQATSTIPIVSSMGTPVEVGLVASLAHPGGNITGVTSAVGFELGGKKLQLLKEIIPSTSKVAFLLMLGDEQTKPVKYLHEAAAGLGIALSDMPLQQSTKMDFERAFDAMAKDPPDAIYLSGRSDFYGQRWLVVHLAEKTRIPAIYPFSVFVELGGLISYGDNVLWDLRQMAGYVARILAGAKPADLPIEQPTQFELAVNLKTAKALGITIPPSILARADKVIE